MKILQFTPTPLIKAPDNRPPGRRSAVQADDFAAHLKPAPAETAADPGGVVSLENQRALRLPPGVDLGLAGQILVRLDQAIRTAPPEVLRRVHDLEGLVCIYRKTSDG
jgi:hypothetical protein